MRTVKWSAFLSGLCGVAVALGMLATTAHGAVTTERGASILAFPKVLADGESDTIIQITNISNNMVHARCFYVNAQLGLLRRHPLWQETDFSIWLTKQQPTHWQVSTGRFVDPDRQLHSVRKDRSLRVLRRRRYRSGRHSSRPPMASSASSSASRSTSPTIRSAATT